MCRGWATKQVGEVVESSHSGERPAPLWLTQASSSFLPYPTDLLLRLSRQTPTKPSNNVHQRVNPLLTTLPIAIHKPPPLFICLAGHKHLSKTRSTNSRPKPLGIRCLPSYADSDFPVDKELCLIPAGSNGNFGQHNLGNSFDHGCLIAYVHNGWACQEALGQQGG